jgi:hypothetical protein
MPIDLMTAMVFSGAFGGVLALAVGHERLRRNPSAPQLPDWRTALGNALVEAVVMVGALAVVFAAIAMRSV